MVIILMQKLTVFALLVVFALLQSASAVQSLETQQTQGFADFV